MTEKSYRRLADHLDQLPGGFAPSRTDAHIRVLQRLFTPEEADLAIHLTLEREPAATIARRAGLPAEEAEQRLAKMAKKGLIFSVHPETGPILYQAVPFIVGIYEFQVNNLDKGMIRDLSSYWSSIKPRRRPQTIPQMRTVPVGKSIEPHLEALPYEQVEELVQSHDRFAVAPCICRRQARLVGDGCDAPEESCLMFDDWADYYVRDGRGRAIDRSEVEEILQKADAANLVLQPSNSKDVAAICCCCGCCCGVLGSLKRHPRPADADASAFVALLEQELCEGCWVCLDRCQMAALAEDGAQVALDSARCIGCGLCVTTCPTGALTMQRKPEGDRTLIPDSIDDTWRIISQAQAEVR